ncbi:unnamed protein product [Cylindrotheca closterium]|uniref:DUF6824 domain-containing protein n=1 Tax=Cylindrotheca closterium TaxID=2856 RepID=A0AAD2G4H4_9STRA|nr:unnamed protein product [Cylindrotheca closterium]
MVVTSTNDNNTGNNNANANTNANKTSVNVNVNVNANANANANANVNTRTGRRYIEGQPNINDVLYGSGKGAYNHPGNQLFHKLVKDSLQEYYEVKTHRSKQDIAQRVIKDIGTRDPPGRFLRYNKENQKWFQVEADESLAKTQQQFRNRVSMDRKALRKSKGGPKDKPGDFHPEQFTFNTQAVNEMSDASRVVLDLEIIELLGDIFLEIRDLNEKYATLNSKSFGSLVMNLPGRGQLKIFQAASTLVYATQADKATGVESHNNNNNSNKRQRQGFVAASANARPQGILAPNKVTQSFGSTTANPFVAAPAAHGAIIPQPLALQGTTVPPTRNNDWVHPQQGVGAKNLSLVPTMPNMPAMLSPAADAAAGQTSMAKNPPVTNAGSRVPNQTTGTVRDINNGSANPRLMNVDPTTATTTAAITTKTHPSGENKVSDAVNEDNRIIRNEEGSINQSGKKINNISAKQDSTSQEKKSTAKSSPMNVQHVVMGTLVTLFVEVMRLQLEHPKWDPLEHSQSIYEMCSEGKYASTLFEVASAFTFRSIGNGNGNCGKSAANKDGQSKTNSNIKNCSNIPAPVLDGLSALGTLADVASESNFGNEVQIANMKPLGGWNRLFVGSILDDLPHGVGCLTYSKTNADNSDVDLGDDKQPMREERYLYGCWSKGYLTSKGWETYANGSEYIGTFQQGIGIPS